MADVLLDACCLMNVCSTGSVPQILRAIPNHWYVCSAVAAETLHINEVGKDGQIRRIKVDLEAWFEDGTLLRCTPDTEQELGLYVHYATLLDDGEAMCLALGESRHWIVASDERKGRRIASAAGLSLLSTPQLMRTWAELSLADNAFVVMLVKRIATLARYRPSDNIPDADWWKRIESDSRNSA